jgi:glucose-6-phosphate isomerase
MTKSSDSTISITGRLLSKVDSNIQAELLEISKRLAKLDDTIWGKDSEAKTRLGWVNLPKTSRDLLPTLDALSAWARSNSITNFVLCGMGGSSLGPEVIAKTYGKKLVVLDSTDPRQISAAIPNDLERLSKTLFIISSKSGTTIETLSQFEYIKSVLTQFNLNVEKHFVIVTDSGSALAKMAEDLNLKLVLADATVGGRFSALSAFGLVPSALIGIDVATLLDDAESALKMMVQVDSPAISLAVLLFTQTQLFFTVSDDTSDLVGFSDWLEQLVAESTGKNKTGRLPVVVRRISSQINGSNESSGIRIVTNSKNLTKVNEQYDLIITAPLGAAFLIWEWATALLGYLLKVDPFNQPNVAEAKEQTNIALNSSRSRPPKSYSGENFTIYSEHQLNNISEIRKMDFKYLAVMAYVHRDFDRELFELQENLATFTKRPVTVGYGPRFLHSTGQFHKGGPQAAVFIQIVSKYSDADLNGPIVPGQKFSFARLISAQADGDRIALEKRQRTVIVIEVSDTKKALAELNKLIVAA